MRLSKFNFRIWHTYEGCYIESDKFGSLDGIWGLNPHALDDEAYLEVEICAGLETENHESVFVGDIIEYQSPNGTIRVAEVVESKGAVALQMKNGEQKDTVLVGYFSFGKKNGAKILRVIGNKHFRNEMEAV